VSRVVSASGEKYSTGDDTLVFWNKGKTAFIIEQGGDTTFANCLEKN
jgi:membrane-bound inhibitor of C-type lysozyme